jgi:hypothetical protein
VALLLLYSPGLPPIPTIPFLSHEQVAITIASLYSVFWANSLALLLLLLILFSSCLSLRLCRTASKLDFDLKRSSVGVFPIYTKSMYSEGCWGSSPIDRLLLPTPLLPLFQIFLAPVATAFLLGHLSLGQAVKPLCEVSSAQSASNPGIIRIYPY